MYRPTVHHACKALLVVRSSFISLLPFCVLIINLIDNMVIPWQYHGGIALQDICKSTQCESVNGAD